jgi:hypothetical protein
MEGDGAGNGDLEDVEEEMGEDVGEEKGEEEVKGEEDGEEEREEQKGQDGIEELRVLVAPLRGARRRSQCPVDARHVQSRR